MNFDAEAALNEALSLVAALQQRVISLAGQLGAANRKIALLEANGDKGADGG